MPEIFFYHLEKTPLQQALPELLEKVVQRGWRAYVHFGEGGHEDDKIDTLNAHLWGYRADSFLAHGLEGNDDAAQALDARQPVLLGRSGDMVNSPQCYVSVSPVAMPDVSAMERCLLVFEGRDDEHIGWARATWKRLKAEGASLAYWKQNEQGRWERAQ